MMVEPYTTPHVLKLTSWNQY